MKFINIKNINDIAPFLSHPAIVHYKRGDYTILDYTNPDKNLFKDMYHREARGITFDINGNIVSRPFHKFFNYMETPEYNLDFIKSKKIKSIREKLDGSMITFIYDNGNLIAKTTAGFDNRFAIMATEYINKIENLNYKEFIGELINNDLTPIFEIITPENQVVVKYDLLNLVFLNSRNLYSGLYNNCNELVLKYNIKHSENIYNSNLSIEDLISTMQKQDGIEGYVIEFEDGDLLKLKTQWYYDCHYHMTYHTERSIAELIYNKHFDDVYAKMVELNKNDYFKEHLKIVENIRDRFNDGFYNFMQQIKELSEIDKQLNQKEYALKHNGDPYLALVLSYRKGGEMNYLYHYWKNNKKIFSPNIMVGFR